MEREVPTFWLAFAGGTPGRLLQRYRGCRVDTPCATTERFYYCFDASALAYQACRSKHEGPFPIADCPRILQCVTKEPDMLEPEAHFTK